MGVDRSDYIMYGWKLPYKIKDNEGNEIDLWDEKFESVMCGFPGEELLEKDLIVNLKKGILRHQFDIYDRYGMLMFRTGNSNSDLENWDGFAYGKTVESGVYVWFAKLELVDGSIIYLTGDVTKL